MNKINRFTRRTLTAEEVYCFNVILCDNEIDRDYESFTIGSLHKLAELFIGKTGIFNHDPKGENQTARIYDTQVLVSEDKITQVGEPYTYLFAKAYMVKNQKNQDLILEIDAGIKKEVSVGCSVSSVTCSICGTDLKKKRCEHTHGVKYNNKLCYSVLDNPTDAYEWSFVAVPAQKNAGVTKKYQKSCGCYTQQNTQQGVLSNENRKPDELLKLFQMAQQSVVLTKDEVFGLSRYIDNLKEEAKLGKEFRKWKQNRVKSLFLLQYPQLSTKTAESLVEKMSNQELSEMDEFYQTKHVDLQLCNAEKQESKSYQKEFKI